jgi:hypothetical protein
VAESGDQRFPRPPDYAVVAACRAKRCRDDPAGGAGGSEQADLSFVVHDGTFQVTRRASMHASC